jgi:hypothetical protein
MPRREARGFPGFFEQVFAFPFGQVGKSYHSGYLSTARTVSVMGKIKRRFDLEPVMDLYFE